MKVCIDPATVNTGIEKRDEHLKTEDYFDIAKYPTICFESTNVSKTENGYIAKGNLTMHGVTKSVEINFAENNKVLTGSLKVNRTDFSIGGKGSKMVGHDVNLKIICNLKE